jgi:hypothetical protein
MKRFIKMQKGIFVLLLVLCWGMGTAYAYDFSKTCSTGQTLYYNIIDATNRYVEITYPGTDSDAPWAGFTKPTGNITLPTTVSYNGVAYTVKAIGNRAFLLCDGLTGSLIIPNSVTSIGWNAFYRCTGFTGTLTIPNSVTMINNYAFYCCSEFTGTLTIPESVTFIGYCAFDSCSGFTGSLDIPNSVIMIHDYAFENCSGFTGSLTIGNSVTTIGDYAFQNCSGFTGSLVIGSSVTSIGLDAFYGCTGFTQVYYNAVNCADANQNPGGDFRSPFGSCGGTLFISDDVVRIPAYMFYGCFGFTGLLDIPNSVTTIGEAAFLDCTGFTGPLTLGSSLTTIGHGAFYGCLGLTGSLTIPNSVTMIDNWAFSNCSSFTGSLTIGNSVTTIGMFAFENCNGFTNMILGNSVTTIGMYAFESCDGLTSMTVHAETPPTLESNVFRYVPTDIPVYVPCSVLDAYQSASGWSNFTNYQCNPEVIVTAVPTEGGTVSGGGFYTNGETVTVAASSNEGYLFMCWSSNGAEVCYNDTYSFTVTDDVVLEAMFMPSDSANIIGEDPYYSDNFYFPSWSYYNYSMTQQIYTASELEGITTITDISFFNAGAEKTRVYDIYLKHTDKTTFDNRTDWISVTADDLVCSDTVIMKRGEWTTIELDTPFAYDGTSNLVLVMDDNSGNWSNPPHMECRVFDAAPRQAIYVYSDGTNFNPLVPPTSYVSGENAGMSGVKNQIMLNRQVYDIAAVSANPSAGTVIGTGQYGQGDLCRLVAITNSGCTFLCWTDDTGTVISTDDEYAFFVTEDKSLTAHFLTSSDVCSLTFDLYDSYGDGWNDNYLVVDFGNGTTQQLTVQSGKNATYTLPVEDGSHVELSWIKGDWTGECYFTLSYENGEVMYIGYNIDETYTYGFDMDCAGQPSEVTYIGDHSTATNYFLPSFSYYNYGLSEQIYTADEVGGVPGIINGIAFYNGGTQAKTRTYDIYLKATEKSEFASPTDWVAASEDDMVFSGNVTLAPGKWTPIIFTYPFDYDGVSNLVMIVDDNTGEYFGAPHMACRVFNTQELQAIRAYDDNIDYDPYNPSVYDGALTNVKNQILFDITSACVEPSDLNTTSITDYSAIFNWEGYQDSYNVRYREAEHIENAILSENFENGMSQWTLIDADGDRYNWRLASEVIGTGYGHYGSDNCVLSQSYYLNTVLYPDNYLVSPQLQLGGTLAFYACAFDGNWAAEHFGVAVSTTGNTNPSDFTTIQEWTMTAKGEGVKTGEPRGGDRAQGNWYRFTVDLSAYAGQTGYVALRHFNCYDQYYLEIDDIALGTPVEAGSWTTVTATGNSIEVYDLNPGTEYEWQVQGINCDGQGGNSEWSDMVTFVTEPIVTQTFNLSQGWNWWSTYIDITLDDLKTVLVAAAPGTNIKIKSQSNGSISYNGSTWRGALNSLDVSQMYMISVSTDCEITLTGVPINPAEHPVTITNGVNWIAFPLSQSMTLSNAFAGFAVSGDKVKSQTTTGNYNGSSWRPNISLAPGQGYMYISNTQGTRTFTFPASAQ